MGDFDTALEQSLTKHADVWETLANIPQVRALLEQVRGVRWVSSHGSGKKICPACLGTYPDHLPDCARQAALAPFKAVP